MTLHFTNVRLIDPEAGTDAPGSLTVDAGRILARDDAAPEGARVIDLFAGSGALGLEAISRGAAFCLFVETDSAARGAIRNNIETLGLYGTTRLHRRSATDLGDKPASTGAPFDLAFLDPPYHKDLLVPALTSLHRGGWLADDAVVMAEMASDEAPLFNGWDTLAEKTYGAAKVVFLTPLTPP